MKRNSDESARTSSRIKGKRDRAILATLLSCGLRRRELAELDFEHLQSREEHWAIVNLVGKGGHVRTVPVPNWVKQTIRSLGGCCGTWKWKSLSLCV